MARAETLDDPHLGRLVRQVHGGGGYNGTVPWQGGRIALDLDVALDFEQIGDSDLAAALAVARTVLEQQDEWHAAFANRAATDLLAVKNDSWLEEDESPVDEGTFLARLIPTALSVDPTGLLGFTFADGDLFWGHWISVTGSLAEGATHAGLEG